MQPMVRNKVSKNFSTIIKIKSRKAFGISALSSLSIFGGMLTKHYFILIISFVSLSYLRYPRTCNLDITADSVLFILLAMVA